MTVRRSSKRRVNDPAALADRLPADLRSFHPVPGSHHFHDHARRIAEWLNTQQAGLGYLTPDVMAAAGLTASAWFRQSLAARPSEEGVFAAMRPVDAAPTKDTHVEEQGAQAPGTTPEAEGDDEPTWFVYEPDLSTVPAREPRAPGHRLIVVDEEDIRAAPD